MAQSYVTDAGTLIIPGAYSSIKVQTANSGLAATGILMLVGEADAGPRFSSEADLESNSFGPDQLAAVVSKYKSGPLVDAFRNAAAPANDPNIAGSPNRFVLVKTNLSTKASGSLPKQAGGTYGSLKDRSYGKLGNLIYWQVAAATSEVVPSTGSFSFIPPVGTVGITFRVNGDAAVSMTTVANIQPAAFVAQIAALSGVIATGGVDRTLLVGAPPSGTLALDANPGGAGATVIELTRSGAWSTAPVIGDTLVIPVGSVVEGASQENVGAYVVTAVTASTLRATKLSDAGKVTPAPVIGTITNPADVSAAAIAATTDAQAFSPVTISNEAGDPIDGVGKALEIAETTGGTDLLSRTAFVLGTSGAVAWVSKSGSAKLLTSAAEQRANLQVNRQTDNISEELIAGGEIALKIGYLGTTAQMTITDTTLSTTVVGGSGGNLSITLADFPTISDLATYINSQTGYSCSVGTAVLGQLSSSYLDNVVAQKICGHFGEQPGRVKIDAYRMFAQIRDSSVLVQLNEPEVQADAGLPKVTTGIAYLSGGSKGGSSGADFTAAIDALAAVRGNFLVPLISRDAASDIADGLTEASSDYAIDAVNAYAKSHCLKMSTLKKRRNRQAFCSKLDTFANAKAHSANLASFRVSVAFQDFKQVNSSGSLVQFQPWMGAVLAAGMQAAGFYRAIVNKGINTSGVLMRDASFSDKDDSQVEDALLAGLLPARKSLTGGFTWVSDQTTYGKDSNFVFNSIQAVYVADIIALSTAQRMEAAFVGQSVADVSAGIAKAYLEGIMADFMSLKLIAPSDDAPKGFKNLSVQISGPAMVVSLEVKLAGAIYFIPISFLVSQVTQTA
jgi:hypothetical protein